MKTKDFEKAIDALDVQNLEILEMKLPVGSGGHVGGVYARIGELTYLKWDTHGRGFTFEIDPDVEGCTVVSHPEYLDYRRDADFDLKFE